MAFFSNTVLPTISSNILKAAFLYFLHDMTEAYVHLLFDMFICSCCLFVVEYCYYTLSLDFTNININANTDIGPEILILWR